MKKIFFILISLLNFSFSSVAQQYFHKVRLSDECNRAWIYNQDRFYNVLWNGMMAGKITAFTTIASDDDEPTFPADIYAYVTTTLRDEYNYDDDVYYDTYYKISTHEDSLSLLHPHFMSISFDSSQTAEWIIFEVTSMISFDYKFSFPEACRWLDHNNAYWVNPYNLKDSVLFSTALKEQRYQYAENGNYKKVQCNYCDQLVQEPILFKGFSLKYANLRDLPNRPYFYTPKNRGYKNLVNVIMEAFYKGEIKGYVAHPLVYRNAFFKQEMSVDDLMKGFYEPGDDYYQSQLGYDPYTSIKTMLSEADMISVGSKLTLSDGAVVEKPYQFTVCFSVEHPSNYTGYNLPLISFRYEDAIKILESSKLIWYAADNDADSCKFSEAITQEKIYWHAFTLLDREFNFTGDYRCESDSATIKMSPADTLCSQGLVSLFSEHAEKTIRTSIAKSNYPYNPLIPVYKRYESVRNFNAIEDTVIRSTIFRMSEYFIAQGEKGNLKMYANDSLKRTLSKEELVQGMLNYNGYYDKDGNLVEAYDTLTARDLCSVNVYVTMELNAKGKVVITDRFIQLCIPAELNMKAIEIPVVWFSYKEAEAFMKKDKEGKKILKTIQSTRMTKDYEWVYNRYGMLVYDYWDEDTRKAKFEKLPAGIQKYFRY